MNTWPTHPDGRPKKVGEMTSKERDRVFRDSIVEVKKHFERPEVLTAITKVLQS